MRRANKAMNRSTDSVLNLSVEERQILNSLQNGVSVCSRPFKKIADELKVTEECIVEKLKGLRERGVVNRFGPLINADQIGGTAVLAAMRVPEEEFGAVAAAVSAFPEVSQNYRREHPFNLWFVIAVEDAGQVSDVAERMTIVTKHKVYLFPKEKEFVINLRFDV